MRPLLQEVTVEATVDIKLQFSGISDEQASSAAAMSQLERIGAAMLEECREELRAVSPRLLRRAARRARPERRLRIRLGKVVV
jgi:hypothetical protein